jgi:protein SCO1/2
MNAPFYRCVILAVLIGTMAGSKPSVAATAPGDYRNVGISLPANAALPLDVVVRDEKDQPWPLRKWVRQPTVLIFADFTCTTLCGPIVAFVAAAIEKSGLEPGDGYKLLVIGLDPKDTASDMAKMRTAEVPSGALGRAGVFVRADADTVRRLTAALGYRFIYDREQDQFVHPGAAYVLRADGRVSRVLTGLGISPGDMRLALVEAGEGRIGTLGDQVRLLCSGFDPTHGVYNVMVSRIVAGVGLATMLMLGGLLGVLTWADRRRDTT